MTDELVISGLEVSIGSKKILKGMTLTVKRRGPRADGPKRDREDSLPYALMGHPGYVVTAG